MSLSAGAAGGDIRLANTQIVTVDQVSFSAPSGLVDFNGGVLAASRLYARADRGFSAIGYVDHDNNPATPLVTVAYTTVDKVDIELSDTGDINLALAGPAELTHVQAADGAITIEAAGSLVARDVSTLGTSESNDISLTAYPAIAGAIADLTLGQVSAGGRGDVTLRAAQGFIQQLSGGLLSGDELGLVVASGLNLAISANAISIQTLAAGNVTLSQTGRDKLTLKQVVVANGDFTLTADGTVEVVDLVLATDRVPDVTSVTGAAPVVSSASASDVDADRTLDFTGVSLVAGGIYRVVIDGTAFTYVASTTDQRPDIAAGLAQLIAAQSPYGATATGSILTIGHRGRHGRRHRQRGDDELDQSCRHHRHHRGPRRPEWGTSSSASSGSTANTPAPMARMPIRCRTSSGPTAC